MSYQSDFNDDVLKDKLKTLLDEDNAIKKIDKILGRDKLKNAPSLLN